MAIYLIAGSFIFWFGYMNKSKTAYTASLLLLFFLTAFRDWRLGGTDAVIYHDYFLNATDLSALLGGDYGVGYVLLNYIIRGITENYLLFQVVYAALTTFILHKVLSKLDMGWFEKCTALFGYFCLRFIYNDWISLRQNFANLIFWFFLISWYQSRREEGFLKKTIFLIAALYIPTLFHSSAIVNAVFILGVWGFSKLRMEFKSVAVPIGAIILYGLGGRLLAPAVNIMTTFVSDRYDMYTNTASLGSNLIYFVLRLMFFFFLSYRYYNEDSETRDATLDIFSMMILIAAVDLEIVSRVFEYYAIGLYASIGTFFRSFSDRSKNIAAFVFFACMMVILVRFLMTFNSPSFIPYRFWRAS